MKNEAMAERLRDLIELQSFGAVGTCEEMGRKGGAGPSGAKTFKFGDHALMVPTLNSAVRESRFTFEACGDGFVIKKDGQVIETAQEVAQPRFYERSSSDGIPFRKIARLHGSDCLASTVIQECVRYNDTRMRCRFCSIGTSLEAGGTIHTKTPQQLAEAAVAARDLDGVTHVTLTSGTTEPVSDGVRYLGQCAAAVKEASGLPVQIQFEPPEDPAIYDYLKSLGVDDVGIHIESFDPVVRRRCTPGKSTISEAAYFKAFEDAVAVFGRNRVSTYVILGLGEDEALTLEQCRKAVEIGVYPFLVPLRPVDNTYMAKVKPPDAEYLQRMYLAVAQMLKEKDMSADGCAAGCAKCKACSILQMIE
ncbi:MSMEG_0568 family radical SAM protein [Geomonas subterranea]|uniref:MSMEG_0568 family radical SAM protein n=1 Tax=Geomonas subterranea TaxID=2847989 RepID=A0ABX8LLU5_9BACT|nr:MSMEG_0568 family radical SAM protein [Geomonas subterranea]QXE92657.1 MSMEG_0568 family radical SAM protein [Geomonas subterranea]QXM09244.1 MSMEG_0568 family radical SAM protein [Geomonas subterranea]